MNTRKMLIGLWIGAASLVFLSYVAPVESAFTIVELPDTQKYSQSYPEIFDSQTSWIVNNMAALNIKFVVHVGDIVDNSVQRYQWDGANHSMNILNCCAPYLAIPGDHDLYPGTLYNEYFPYTRYSGASWYGGHYPSSYPADTSMCHYAFFSADSKDFLVLGLRMAPDANMLQWANNVINSYPDRQVILFTHDYLDCQNRRTASGTAIWEQLVQFHDNIPLVICGHEYITGRRTDYVNGRPVHQVLANYQNLQPTGGNGWLRYYTFDYANSKIDAATYSPYLNSYWHDVDNEFTLDLMVLTPTPTLSPTPTETSTPTTVSYTHLRRRRCAFVTNLSRSAI